MQLILIMLDNNRKQLICHIERKPLSVCGLPNMSDSVAHWSI